MSEGLPWFPFYVDDFMASPKVRRMDAESVGVYLLLMVEQWQAGAVVGDVDELAGVVKSTPQRVENVLEACFRKTNSGWENTRLKRVQLEQAEKRARRQKAAKASWDKRSSAFASALHKQPEPEPEPKETARPARRKKKATQLPADWKPNNPHRSKAKELGVSLSKEEEKFRLHAEENGRTAKSWNAAFTRWLINAKDFQPRRTTHDSESDDAFVARELRIIEERAARRRTDDPGPTRLNIELPESA